MVDCSTEADGNFGCDGGFYYGAWTYTGREKIETESDYPYTGVKGTCNW